MDRAARTLAVLWMSLLASAAPAHAWDRGRVQTFALMPPGSSGPEGLEVGPGGHVYVTGFGFTASGSSSGQGQLTVFDERGQLIRQVPVSPAVPA